MSHRHALLLMILVTLLWSTAGVVTRHLEAARSFEVTFWRSAFNALSLIVLLRWLRGPALWGQLLRAPRLVWLSGACWAAMFTAFMVAITMASVATVLVTMALGPLLTALFSRLFLHHRLPARTWAAIGMATLGIAWMFGQEADGAGLAGVLVALLVPLAAATNWTLLQRATHGNADPDALAPGQDMLPAVLIGALISALLTLPLAWPFQASAHDLGLLGFLGLCQLAIPCLLVVRLSRVLPAPEIALLGQLEVIFGVLWAWLGAGEAPAGATLIGGATLLAALAGNEILALRQRRPQ
ncbi:DMT family transporter [Roseateles microcysteis]|uniref:DMT family transporter n=1 Tax=Roseateles microcysteis TaxID=3119057 RepID=UPI002FE67560